MGLMFLSRFRFKMASVLLPELTATELLLMNKCCQETIVCVLCIVVSIMYCMIIVYKYFLSVC